jgi:hypothetical protein
MPSISRLGRALGPLTVGVALVACGPSVASVPMPGSSDSSSGLPQVDASEAGTSPSSPGSDTSSGDADASTDAEASSTGDVDGVGPTQCEAVSACATSCSRGVHFAEGTFGEACDCVDGVEPDGEVSCHDAGACDGVAGRRNRYLCMIQAMRYGREGILVWDASVEETTDITTIEMLRPGIAQAHNISWQHTCCHGASVDSTSWYTDVLALPPEDDGAWDACVADVAMVADDPSSHPPCLDLDGIPGRCDDSGFAACEGPATPVIPNPACEFQCPMAGDGVCDEAAGTGLCTAGCDPVDCACADDMPGVCDETDQGGSCPLGTDADDCDAF